MVTKGERRLGRTIRKLENSVEFSAKETRAKQSEKEYRENAQKTAGYTEDSPVQNLRELLAQRKNPKNPNSTEK
jgi:hypothetical protein